MGNVFRFKLGDPDGMRKGVSKFLHELNGRELSPERQAALDELAATLREAAIRGDREVFVPLAKPTGSLKDREPSLLPWAAIDGHAEIVDALISASADVNEVIGGIGGMSVLAMAAAHGQVDVVRCLLAAGAAVSNEKTCIDVLSAAVKSGNEEVFDMLIEAGADLNARSIVGSPLLQATKAGNLIMMSKLIAAGADVQIKWMLGNNLIAEAIGEEELDDDRLNGVIRFLIEHRIAVNERNTFGRTPLMIAVESGRKSVVETLLAGGADPNVVAQSPDPAADVGPFSSADHTTALILASRHGRTEIASLLLAAGVAVGCMDKSGLTALQWANRNCHAAVAEAIMAAGASADDASPQALLSGARNGDAAAVRKAIEAAVDVNVRDEACSLSEEVIGPTPLILAAAAGHSEVVAVLLCAGADVELQSQPFPASINPLMAAAENGHVEVMKQLLAAGANIHAKNEGFEGGRMQPLHFAALGGQPAAVELLLAHDAKVKAKTAEKETPLHLAVSAGDLESVRLLLAIGADPKAKDGYGSTPRERLKHAKRKNRQIGPLLEKAEAATPATPARPKAGKRAPAIPHEWEDAAWEIDRPDFRSAAESEAFCRAIMLATAVLGVESTEQEDFPGAKLFKVTRGTAVDLTMNHREELAELGAMAFHGLGRGAFQDADPDCLMLIPTTDWERAVAFIQTADPNGNKGPGQIIAGLRQLYRLRPYFVTEIAHDTIAGHFTAPAENNRELAKWMEAFCSDIVSQGTGSVSKLARQLQTSDQMFFWWD